MTDMYIFLIAIYFCVVIVSFGFMGSRKSYQDSGIGFIFLLGLLWPVWLLGCLGVWLSIAWGDDG